MSERRSLDFVPREPPEFLKSSRPEKEPGFIRLADVIEGFTGKAKISQALWNEMFPSGIDTRNRLFRLSKIKDALKEYPDETFHVASHLKPVGLEAPDLGLSTGVFNDVFAEPIPAASAPIRPSLGDRPSSSDVDSDHTRVLSKLVVDAPELDAYKKIVAKKKEVSRRPPLSLNDRPKRDAKSDPAARRLVADPDEATQFVDSDTARTQQEALRALGITGSAVSPEKVPVVRPLSSRAEFRRFRERDSVDKKKSPPSGIREAPRDTTRSSGNDDDTLQNLDRELEELRRQGLASRKDKNV